MGGNRTRSIASKSFERIPVASGMIPMALEATTLQAQRVVLEECPEGVYVLVFKADDRRPCQDHLQDGWEMAKRHAFEDFGITDTMWREIPDTGIMRS